MMAATHDRRREGRPARARRFTWEVSHGAWGGVLIVAAHQAVLAVILAWDTYVANSAPVIPVPGRMIWPFVFAAGAAGAFDIYLRRYRSRVDLAQAMVLLAYGSRAMGLILGGIFDRWTTQTSISVAGWVALMLFTQRSWSEARRTL